MDPVRGITNRSSGKMGVEIAKEAFKQGAEVTMLCGRMQTHVPKVFDRVQVESVEEMDMELEKLLKDHDIFVSAAAVSDFTVEKVPGVESGVKISSDEDLTLKLKPAPKLLTKAKKINPDIFLVGFKAEYNVPEGELIESARQRMNDSGTDLMVANDVAVEGSGFGSDKNQIILIDDDVSRVLLTSKAEVACRIVSRIAERI